MSQPPKLKRSLGLFALVAYGVGNTLGAGIYAMVGKIAGIVGPACWMSFLIAVIAAGFTALSYAELSARYPYASGEAHYTYEAMHCRIFSHGVGFIVLMSGVTSMCAVSHAFAGYLAPFFPSIPLPVIVLLFFAAVSIITFSGMDNSSFTNILCTAVEVTGLLIVVIAGMSHFGEAKINYAAFLPTLYEPTQKIQALLSGSVLAFYAFIGFEDMVKASEEVKDPQKNLPRGILLTVCVTCVLYILVSMSAVTVLSPEALQKSTAPLMDVVKTGLPQIPIWIFTCIALFAVSNTALVNFMMAGRVLYGMAQDGLVPVWFGKVHPKSKIPHVATTFVLIIVLILALSGNLTRLAQSTAVLLLSVFLCVNFSLLVLKIRKVSGEEGIFRAPFWAPVLGALSSFGLLFYASVPALLTALTLLAISFALFFLNRFLPKENSIQ